MTSVPMKNKLRQDTRTPDISFIILTWNSEKYIEKCLFSYEKSLFEQGKTAEFIIIDNGSTDKTANLLEQVVKPFLPACCTLDLVKLGKNYGTTVSRNIGIKKARGEVIVICDSDTELIQGEWSIIFSLLKNNQQIGVIAPSLFYENGEIQHSVKKFPTLTEKLKKVLKILFDLPVKNEDFYENFPWKHPTTVDSAISACWILLKETIEKIGLLDEKIFYSPEDLDYCLRMWEGGKQVLYYPDMQVIHHTQQITHNKPFSPQSISHLTGLFYYFLKHRYCFSRHRLYKRLNQ